MQDGLAVVVVNYGSHDMLLANLRGIGRPELDPLVVVVDNPTTADERARLRRLAEDAGWHTVLPPANVGFGAGINLGVAHARALGARTFLILNPDACIAGADLAALWERHARTPWSLVAPVVRRPDGSVWSRGSHLRLDSGSHGPLRSEPDTPVLPWISGACFVVGEALWDELGGFDEDYFLYWEDVDLSVRATRAGAELIVVDDAEAVHDEGGTQSDRRGHARGKSDLYYYYNIRNRLLFAAKLLDDADLRRWRRHAVRAAHDVLLQGGRRQFGRPLRPLRAAVRGTVAGLLTARRLRPQR